MTIHIPPSEAELNQWRSQSFGVIGRENLDRMFAEIFGLRALCAQEARNVYELRNVDDWDEVCEHSEESSDRLRAASEGKV